MFYSSLISLCEANQILIKNCIYGEQICCKLQLQRMGWRLTGASLKVKYVSVMHLQALPHKSAALDYQFLICLPALARMSLLFNCAMEALPFS